jgi:hypothetical protein
MTVSIDTLEDETGLLVEDRIEQRQCRLFTDRPVSPSEVNRGNFLYPLDVAVNARFEKLTVSKRPIAYLREIDGTLIEGIDHFTEKTLSNREYILEVPGPVKLYFRLRGPLTVSVDAVQMTLSFEGQKQVFVGARSYHDKPAATITTTENPEDLMVAISYFSSALKTTGPERSYPNLRGHPPELDVGDKLQVPSHLERLDGEVRIEVPPDLMDLLVVAPLAYYTGAELVSGEQPRIVTDNGFIHTLNGPKDLESEVERVLKQVFLFDCITRTEGTYGMPLYERQCVEPELAFDLGDLYNSTAAERLESYLSVPFGKISDYVPQWKLTAHLTETPESIEILPFLVDDLAVIKSPTRHTAVDNSQQLSAIEEFARARPRRSGGTRDRNHDHSIPSFVEPEETDSIEQAWVGNDVPIGASKAMIEAFRNRLARDEKDGDIDIVVVCNDSEMLDEHNTANEVYGSRDELPFDVTLFDALTTNRLRLVLESDIDYFHYIGHIDEGGFECEDGSLDVGTLDSVGVDTFFLNACQSYHQGVELIRSGSIGGVVTLDEVINSGAIRVGKTMTRVLNRGFPLRAALNIARERSIVGNQYIVVGDGNAEIAHTASVIPNLVEISSKDSDTYNINYQGYYSSHFGVGSYIQPKIKDNGRYHLTGSSHTEYTVDRETIENFFSLEVIPVRIDGTLTWSDQLEISEFD